MSLSTDSHDDLPIESPDAEPLISRRAALTTLGFAGAAALLAACGSAGSSSSATTTSTAKSSTKASGDGQASAAVCAVLTKEQEQGPFYYAAAAIRSDITDGKSGIPMRLELSVMDVTTCRPVPNVGVDIWQADALGDYSDTSTGLFLRGLQTTDAKGVATFTSIYPGWYPARTNHVHVKVHVGGSPGSTYTGGHVSHTGNLFFPEAVSTTVEKVSPYTDNPTHPRVTLTEDAVYKSQNGSGTVMKLTPVDASAPEKGYVASITLGVDTNATPAAIGISGTVS